MASNSSPSEFGEVYEDLRQLSGAIFDQTLSEVTRRAHLTLEAGGSVEAAVSAMNASSVGYALVVEDDRLVGIVTERDMFTKVCGGDRVPLDAPVERIMTPDPETLPNHASVAFALNRMRVQGYRHIPLVDDDGKPVGVVGLRDIVHWMVDQLPEAILNLPPDASYPKSVDGG